MPTTTEILDKLKQNPKMPLTKEVEESLRAIKVVCDSKYSNQSFYGNAALNRQMLLDPQIAKLLTPEVLTYIFTNEPTPETKIRRNTSPGGEINLKDAIYYGLKEGLHVIHMMPNNESKYGPGAYEQQQQKFSTNTMQIIANISKAAGTEEIETEQKLDPSGLIDQYERIVRTVNLIKEQGQSDKLLSVPSYTPQNMRDQVGWGFQRLCEITKTQDLGKETLDSFCEKFLNSPEAMLDGSVIHLFYDRAHIDAALEQDKLYKIGDKDYKFQDIFRAMIQKVATNPDNYPPCAKEQFCLRFGLVESDLQNRFKIAHELAFVPKETVPDVPPPIEKVTVHEVPKVETKASYILFDAKGNNFVDGVEEHNGSYIIKGRNSSGQPRSITIDKDGNATGHQGSKVLGIVGDQMYAQRAAIFAHFNIQVPDIVKGISPPPKTAPVQKEIEELDNLKEQPPVKPIQDLGVQRFKAQSKAIDKILDEFKDKIKSIGTHHTDAKVKAEELLINLRKYKSDAFKDPSKESLELFAKQSKEAIKEVTPVLQRDLGWGDYLANLAKRLVNAVTTAVAFIATLGSSNHHGFFALKSSGAVKKSQELDQALDNELGSRKPKG